MIAACYADWTPGVCAKTARKRQIGLNGLLASTARTFQRRRLTIIFGRSFKTCAALRRVNSVGSPGLYPCGRNGLLASTACTFLRRLLIIIFVRFFKTCAPLRREAYFGSPGLYPCSPQPPSGGPAPTLARQSGSRKPLLRPRRKTQRTIVIGARPAPLLPQQELLASTACTFLRRLMIIIFGRFQKTCAPLQREAHFGSPGLSP